MSRVAFKIRAGPVVLPGNHGPFQAPPQAGFWQRLGPSKGPRGAAGRFGVTGPAWRHHQQAPSPQPQCTCNRDKDAFFEGLVVPRVQQDHGRCPERGRAMLALRGVFFQMAQTAPDLQPQAFKDSPMFNLRRYVSKIGLTAPQAQPDRAGLALAVIFKNEARFIEEWARFHLDAGVSMILGYDNGSSDGTAEILKNVAGSQCKIMPWNQRVNFGKGQTEVHNQVLAYVHAASNFGGAYRWMAFIDVDEFLVPTQDASIPDALAPLEGFNNISLPWHMFGRGGQETMPEVGTIAGFTDRYARPGSGARGVCNFKCIVDPTKIKTISVHSIDTGGDQTANDAGFSTANSKRRTPAFYSNARLQLNHYYTRAAADLDAKLSRGRNLNHKLNGHRARVMKIVDQIESDTVQDHAALEFLDRMRGD